MDEIAPMVRLDRTRFENKTFPHVCDVTTRFDDLDRIGHLNNVAIASLLQEGRYRFFADSSMAATPQRQVVVASVFIDFAGDLRHPAPVSVATGVLEIGRSSVRVGQLVLQEGSSAVFAEVVHVIRDEQGTIAIPEDWRTKLESLRIR